MGIWAWLVRQLTPPAVRYQQIADTAQTPDQVHTTLDTLRLRKRQLDLTKRELIEKQRTARARYADRTTQQAWIGGLVENTESARRRKQRDYRRSERTSLQLTLNGLEQQRQKTEAELIAVERAIFQLQVRK